jgi:hypothetical protein
MLLRDPTVQWKRGRSAFELATSWIGAGGKAPVPVRSVLDQAPEWRGGELVVGFFEHPTYLDTWRGPSQTDLFAIVRLADSLGALAIEGKAGESFGELVQDWNVSAGRTARLDWVCALFGVPAADVGALRWQLFHRSAVALLEARRYPARHALMLVHDFSGADIGLTDYCAFAERIGVTGAAAGALSDARNIDGVSLRLGWVRDKPADVTP